MSQTQTETSSPQHLAQLLEVIGQQAGTAVLIAFGTNGTQRIQGSQLAAAANRLAIGLRQRGLAAGDRVALVSGNRPSLVAACLGVMASGCVAVPLDAQMDTDTLRGVLQDSDPALVLASPDQIETVAEIEADAGLEADAEPSEENDAGQTADKLFLLDRFAEAADSDEAPSPRDDAAEQANASEPPGASAQAFPSWRALQADADAVTEANDADQSASVDDVAVMFYTSGTTGAPKGVPLTHRNLWTQIQAVRRSQLAQPQDRVLLPLPLHHVYPLVIGLLSPLALELPVIFPRSLTGPDIVTALREGEATLLIGVPRLYKALYEAIFSQAEENLGRRGRGALERLGRASGWLDQHTSMVSGRWLFSPLHRNFAASLRVLCSGGAPLDAELAQRLQGLGWNVAIGYGLTETSPLLTICPPEASRFDSVGQPIEDVELKIDPDWRSSSQDTSAADSEQPASGGQSPGGPQGESKQDRQDDAATEGEILARGPGVFSGYWNLPEKTEQAFTGDGWFRTGDLGFLDADGWLHVTGRASTLIITEQGEKVQPDAIESAYQEADEIREIGVLQRDRRLVGLVVPETRTRQGQQDPEAQVRQAIGRVNESLPSHQQIDDIALTRKALPRTRIGKLRRKQLEHRYDEAASGEQEPAAPISRDQMSASDRTLVDQPVAGAVWDRLAERFSDQPLTPDSNLRVDLGVDSIEWLNLTMEIMQSTGVELDDETLTRIESVRDLLKAVQRDAGDGEAADLLAEPEEMLSSQQQRRLRPLGPAGAFVSRHGFGLNRRFVKRFLQLRVCGAEHLPESGPFVIAANHASHLDPFALSAALSPEQLEQTYWAAWVGATRRNPFTRLASRLARTVPIDPKRGVISSLAFGAAVLQRDGILVWFPEGQRSVSGELQLFRPGLGMLLHRHRVPVVPAHLNGTYEALTPGTKRLRRHPVSIRFGEALDPAELKRRGRGENAAEKIVDALHEVIARMGQREDNGERNGQESEGDG